MEELERFASFPPGVFGNESPLRQDFSDRAQKIAGHSTLKDESISPGDDRCIDELLIFVSGKHNNPTFAVESPNRLRKNALRDLDSLQSQ